MESRQINYQHKGNWRLDELDFNANLDLRSKDVNRTNDNEDGDDNKLKKQEMHKEKEVEQVNV